LVSVQCQRLARVKEYFVQDYHLLHRGFTWTLIRMSDQIGVFISEKAVNFVVGISKSIACFAVLPLRYDFY